MGYVVYVNHPNNKAIIHDENCSWYKRRRRDRTHNGFWKGIFETYEEALQFAKSTGKKIIDSCAFCIKR